MKPTCYRVLHDLPHQYISFDGLIITPLHEDAVEEARSEFDSEREMPYETEAREAVESAWSSMYFDYASNEISFTNYRGETVSVDSKEQLEDELREIAQEAWISMVPAEEGTPIYEFDESNVVSEALDEYEEQVNEFFSGGDYLLEP